MALFDREDYIIRNRDILDPEYEPEDLDEREREVNEYASYLRPIIKGWNPNNLFIYGDTGIGKTVVTRYVIRELLESVEQYDDIDLNVIELNCTNTSTSYQVAVHLVNEIRKPDSEKEPLTTVSSERDVLSETGYQSKRVFNELYKDLRDLGGTILIILDEIDNIGNDDEVLYELPRARTHHNLDVKLGVIGISNDYQFRKNLSAKVKDTLCEEEFYFEPYESAELQNILRKRTESALFPDTMDSGVIELCSAKAANDSGSARQAIRLLRKSAELAEREAINSNNPDMLITETHVRNAVTEIQKEEVVEGMHDLTIHGKYLLLAITSFAAEGDTPVRTRRIYERYTNLVEQFSSKPLKRRGAHDHISKLNMKSIVRDVDTKGERGNFNKYELDVAVESAIEALEADSTIGELTKLRETAEQNNVIST